MALDNNVVEPNDFEFFIESHKEKETEQLDKSAKALLERMAQNPEGTPEVTAREQALEAVMGGPSHGRVPLQGLLPPNTIMHKQNSLLVDLTLAAVEKANREAEIAMRDAAESREQVQILKEQFNAMKNAQDERDARAEAQMNAFIGRYEMRDTDALLHDDSDAIDGEYDVDTTHLTYLFADFMALH